jgi:cytochrome c peroxidase
MAHYVGGGIERPSKSEKMRATSLNESEVQDIIEFMKSLTGTKQIVSLPVLPN